jgi:hypothetical protein
MKGFDVLWLNHERLPSGEMALTGTFCPVPLPRQPLPMYLGQLPL